MGNSGWIIYLRQYCTTEVGTGLYHSLDKLGPEKRRIRRGSRVMGMKDVRKQCERQEEQHSFALLKRKHFLMTIIVEHWNKMPGETMKYPSLNILKTRSDRHLSENIYIRNIWWSNRIHFITFYTSASKKTGSLEDRKWFARSWWTLHSFSSVLSSHLLLTCCFLFLRMINRMCITESNSKWSRQKCS